MSKIVLADLNVDCLLQICEKMALYDQVRFSKVCRRFRYIFEITAITRLKYIDICIGEEAFEPEARDDFFSTGGKFIQHVMFSRMNSHVNEILKLLATHCPKVQRLIFHKCIIVTTELEACLDSLPLLTSFCISKCILVGMEVIFLLKHLSRLTTMMLVQFRWLPNKVSAIEGLASATTDASDSSMCVPCLLKSLHSTVTLSYKRDSYFLLMSSQNGTIAVLFDYTHMTGNLPELVHYLTQPDDEFLCNDNLELLCSCVRIRFDLRNHFEQEMPQLCNCAHNDVSNSVEIEV